MKAPSNFSEMVNGQFNLQTRVHVFFNAWLHCFYYLEKLSFVSRKNCRVRLAFFGYLSVCPCVWIHSLSVEPFKPDTEPDTVYPINKWTLNKNKIIQRYFKIISWICMKRMIIRKILTFSIFHVRSYCSLWGKMDRRGEWTLCGYI